MGYNTPTPQPEPQQAPEQPQVPVNEATETNNGEQTPQEISKPANKIDKKRLKKLLIGVGVVALVGVTLYGVTSFMTHDSKPKTEVTQKKETPIREMSRPWLKPILDYISITITSYLVLSRLQQKAVISESRS